MRTGMHRLARRLGGFVNHRIVVMSGAGLPGVPRVTFRHGKVLRTLHGEPKLAYYTEFEFADHAAFDAEGRGEAMRAAGEDAAEMGVPHAVYLAEVD